MGIKAKKLIGDKPESILKKINKKVVKQQEKFDNIYSSIKTELKKDHIYIINEKQLKRSHYKFAQEYFQQKVLPTLVPVMITDELVFPYLKDRSIYLIIKLINNKKNIDSKYSLLEIPSDLVPRFLVLPSTDNKDM